MSSRRLYILRHKNNCKSHQYLSMTRLFEDSHVIPGCTHQHLKIMKTIAYSKLQSQEYFLCFVADGYICPQCGPFFIYQRVYQEYFQ